MIYNDRMIIALWNGEDIVKTQGNVMIIEIAISYIKESIERGILS